MNYNFNKSYFAVLKGDESMFRVMRKIDRQLTSERAGQILKNGEFGNLSTLDLNGYPYITPLSYVYMNNAIYFHCGKEGNKLENIKNDNKVCFSVVGHTHILPDKFSTEYESAIIFGQAEFTEGEEKKSALLGLIDKYSKGFKKEGLEYIDRAIEKTEVVKINIKRMTAKGRLPKKED